MIKQIKAKHFVVESYGNEKAIFKATGLRSDGRMPESAKESNWEGLLNTIKEAFHLATTSSFLLVKKDDIDNHVDKDEDLFDLWNALFKNKATSYTLKMVCGLLSSFKKANNKRCLEITKENKKMTWCPKDSNDLNFQGEMKQKNWEHYFEDLKQLIGGLSDGEYLEDESQNNKIETADDLKRIWADRYDEHDSNKWSLKLQVNQELRKAQYETRGKKSEADEQDKEDCKSADNIIRSEEVGCHNARKNEGREMKEDEMQGEYKPRMVSKGKQQSQEPNEKEDEKKDVYDNVPQRSPSSSIPTIPVKKQGEYFDIKSMLELVAKADEAANTIKDQNVILMLGGTGSGKSTLIHFLAGSTMKEQIVDGICHIAPVKVNNKALANVRTSSKSISETRYITAVSINLKEMNLLVDIDSVVLCDTPGFGDTNGPEVDVANGIGIVRALQNCKSVKPVVLICYTALGYRMSCVKDLARTLVSLIPSIENHISAFSYVFTKIPENKIKNMSAQVKDTWNNSKDEPDEGFKAILKDIAKKTKNVVIAPNLVSDSPDSLLESLTDIKEFIKNPGEVFQPFVSESSKGAVQMQVQKHKEAVWLGYQKGDYNVVQTKLDELKELSNVLKLPTIENEYKDIVKKLTNEWNQKYEDAKSIFNKRIVSPHLSKNDVLAYQKVVNELKSANQLRRSHLKDAISSTSLTQNIKKQMKRLINAIEDQKERDESTLRAHLDKIAQVQACFPDFSSSYDEACQKLKKRVTNCVDEAKECIKKNKFMEFRKELEKIGKVLIFQEHLHSFMDIKKEIKNLENELLVRLNNAADEGFVVLKKAMKEEPTSSKEEKQEVNIRIEKLDKTAVDILKKTVPLLEEAANAFDLPYEHVGLDKSTKELIRSFVNRIIEYFEKVKQKIVYLFEKQRYQAFDEIKTFILVLDELRTMEAVKQRTGSQYYQITEKMFGFVGDIQKDIDTILGSLNNPNVSIDYNRLYECILCVSQSKWIDDRQEDGSSNLMDAIKQKLIAQLYELQQSSQNLEIDLDHPELVKDARNIFTHLRNLRRLEMIIPEITPFRQNIGTQLEQSIRSTLATIRREFALEAKNFANQENMKENLIRLKPCAESIHNYLQKKNFENVKDLDSIINATREELTNIEATFESKYQPIANKIQTTEEKISQFEDIKREYGKKNKSQSLDASLVSDNKEAMEYFSVKGYESIEAVEEDIKKEQQNLEKLSEEGAKVKKNFQEQVKELKEKLDKDEQVKKEYEGILQKGM
ncbi:hypothetical protein RFI_21122, partial [Reticulomyxa filosa]